MIARQNGCSELRLRRFIQEQLSAREQASLESHLDTCAMCRQRLEAIAAEPHWWAEARHLGPGADDAGQRGERRPVFTPQWSDDSPAGSSPGDRASLGFLAPSDDPSMLGRLGHYEIAGVVGYGGMGLVLKAFDAALNRYVAIKVLSPQMARSGAARRRFAREAQAAAAVTHENVVPIFAVAEFQGLPYLVMPYIAGESLQRRLDRAGPLGLTEILRIAMQTAAGLAAAHAQGLVHRDVKPANILLADGIERVLITDFGLARAVDDVSLTRSGVIAGTPQYMSPEQARGEPVDHRSDLFSLGSMMYAMCAGRPPFRADSTLAVLRRICESTPRPIRDLAPETPDWLAEIVVKLQAARREERFQTASEVAHLLQRWLAHVQQPRVIPPPQRLARRRPGAWCRAAILGGAACLVALLSAAGALLHDDVAANHASDSAASVPPGNAKDTEATSRGDSPRNLPVWEGNWKSDVDVLRQRVNDVETRWTRPDRELSIEGWNHRRNALQHDLERLEQAMAPDGLAGF